jgi:hypothetical protein
VRPAARKLKEIERLAFEEVKRTKRAVSALGFSISKQTGRLTLNARTSKLFRRWHVTHVLLLWDARERKIALRGVEQGTPNSYTIGFHPTDNTASFLVRGFLRWLGWSYAGGSFVALTATWRSKDLRLEASVPAPNLLNSAPRDGAPDDKAGYQVFVHKMGRRNEPTVTITGATGHIFLNAKLSRILKDAEPSIDAVALLWDERERLIALKAVPSGNHNSFAVTQLRRAPCLVVACKTFLKHHIGWTRVNRVVLPATWNARERLVEVSLAQYLNGHEE